MNMLPLVLHLVWSKRIRKHIVLHKSLTLTVTHSWRVLVSHFWIAFCLFPVDWEMYCVVIEVAKMLKVLLPNRNKKVYVDHLLTFIATRQDCIVTELQRATSQQKSRRETTKLASYLLLTSKLFRHFGRFIYQNLSLSKQC